VKFIGPPSRVARLGQLDFGIAVVSSRRFGW